MSRGDQPDRWRAWWRWLAVPWTEWLLATTVVAAAAAPVFLVAAADVWRAATEDDVAASAVDEASLDRNGVDVLHESVFDADGIARADAAMRATLARVPALAEPDRTIYTLPGLLAIGPPVRRVGPAGRLLARDGALDAVDVVAELPDTDGGVYVSTWFAERHDLALGDPLGFEAGAIVDEEWNDIVQGGGAAAVFPIVGFYEPLWSSAEDAELPAYWSQVPPEVVPQYIRAFDGPNSELVLADEATVLRSGLTGVVRWRARLVAFPSSFDALLDLRARLRRFELALVDRGELGDALAGIATVPGGRPRLDTQLFDTVGDVVLATRRLDAPLGSAQAAGGIVGLAALVAVGAFFVERRRNEFRLLASEGDRWPTMTARVAAQLAAPVVLGTAVGVVAAIGGLWSLGPADRAEIGSVSWGAVGATGAVALVLASLVAGVAGSRTLHRTPIVAPRVAGTAAVLALAAAVAFAWVQVARTAAVGTDVDLVVVVLPVLTVLLAVTLGTIAVAAVLRAATRHSERLPVPAFLAVRQLAVGAAGLRLVAGAIGLGVGLLVFAVALTSTLDRTVDVKLASQIGGESSVTLVDRLPPGTSLPAGTTLVQTFDSTLTPGGRNVRVLAIDPATWAEAVTWPASFGAGPEDVLRRLAPPLDGAVPAIGVRGQPAPTTGAFGLTRTYRYGLVGRTGSLPGAGEDAITLLVDGGALDRMAIGEEGYSSVEEAVADGFLLPTMRFRQRLVSQAPLDELVAAAERSDLRVRDLVSREERRRDPGILAARAAFGYLGVLGVAAATAALVALGLFLESRRRARALTGVMARSMGLPPVRAASVTMQEVIAVLSIAVGAAFVAVPVVVRRVSSRFDPAPDVPPRVGVLVDWGVLVLVAVLSIGVVAVAVWWMEWRAGRRPAGEVLRRGG